uniref:Uncharacterized protein n=1 Tax=Vitis vinifera TaxID=29760 RepID=F6H334_VITVI
MKLKLGLYHLGIIKCGVSLERLFNGIS